MAVHKTVATDYVQIECDTLEHFSNRLSGLTARASGLKAEVGGILGQIESLSDGRASGAVHQYRARANRPQIISVADGSRTQMLDDFLQAALRDICDMLHDNAAFERETPPTLHLPPLPPRLTPLPASPPVEMSDEDELTPAELLEQLLADLPIEDRIRILSELEALDSEHHQILLIHLLAQGATPDQRALLLQHLQETYPDGPPELVDGLLTEAEFEQEIQQRVDSSGILGPLTLVGLAGINITHPKPTEPTPDPEPVDDPDTPDTPSEPTDQQGEQPSGDAGSEGDGSQAENDGGLGEDGALPGEEVLEETAEGETGWEGSAYEDGFGQYDPANDNIGSTFEPIFEDGPSYVSQGNTELYDSYATARTELEALKTSTEEALAQRDGIAAEIRELNAQISSGDASPDAIARSDALRAELRTLDLTLYEDKLRIDALEEEMGDLEDRLARIWPSPDADLEKIRELEGGRTSEAVLRATYTADRSVGCVHYVANRMSIPAAIARNAHMWDQQALDYAEYGIQIGDVPLEGSVIVMEREHSYGHDVYGHVMYVERVEHGVVWVTDNMNPDPVRLTDLTQETSGPFIKYLYMPWHTRA